MILTKPNPDLPPGAGVYFVACGTSAGPVKIGKANNIATRLCGLQTAHAATLHLIGYAEGFAFEEAFEDDDSSAPYLDPGPLEAALHAEFATHRVRGEWFSLPRYWRLDADAVASLYGFDFYSLPLDYMPVYGVPGVDVPFKEQAA